MPDVAVEGVGAADATSSAIGVARANRNPNAAVPLNTATLTSRRRRREGKLIMRKQTLRRQRRK